MCEKTILPDPFDLPRFADVIPAQVEAKLALILEAHRSVIADVVAQPTPGFENGWLPMERAEIAIDSCWATLSHLHAVADTPELRAAYAGAQALLTEHNMAVMQNRDLHRMLQSLSETPGFAGLDDADRAAIHHALRDFRLAGVALDDDERTRFAAISVELSRLANEFASAVLDATDHWAEHITDETMLAGVADNDKAMFAAAAAAKGLGGWLVTLQAPSVNVVLIYAEDRELRARVYEAYNTRASDRGPDAGRFDNGERISRILQLRGEAAGLLGFSDAAELALAPKMASGAAEVLTFLRRLAGRAKPAALQEMEQLRAFASDELGISDLRPWDVAFAAERLRRGRFAVDQQEVRAYFPVERVLDGWRALLKRLFGITLVARDDVELYHLDAGYFDAVDEDGKIFAGLYVDLYARAGKRGGAWMSQARPRYTGTDGTSLPVAYLVCNFPPKTGDGPTLLTHGEVITLLHETGHVLHHLFTRVDRPSVAGTTGFEWDAIELPSQLMEDFAWDRDVLTSMSGHYRSANPLPADLFERMQRARHFQSGMFVVRQIEFALFDMLLHTAPPSADPVAIMRQVRDEVAVIHPPEWNRFPHSFSHIFAGGYAAGYYSYLWAEVLAADAFQRFAEAGGVDRATGDALREEILARGASRPASESFEAFRGRKADPEAMLKRRGLC